MGEKNPVLLVGNFLSGSGGSRGVCEELAIRLHDSGTPVAKTSEKRGRLSRLCDMLQTTWRERNRYAVAQVDVYSGPAFFWAEAVCAALRCLSKPYILTLHGGNLPQFSRRHPWRVKRLLRSANAVTTPSEFLLEKMNGFRGDLRLLPNALDLERYVFRRRERPSPSLVWLRAFHHIYNPVQAVEVLRLLLKKYPDANLTMTGPDKKDGSFQQVREMAAAYGIADRLCLPGGVSKAKVPIWLNRGDVFLNTTNVDNAPVSVLEAMACGLCVVSTNVGGLSYLLHHEVDALLMRPDDPKAMATAVERVLCERDLAGRLSQNGRNRLAKNDWSIVLPQWEALFAEVVERARS